VTTMADARVFELRVHYPDPGPHELFGRAVVVPTLNEALCRIAAMRRARESSGLRPAQYTLRSFISDDI
jgi:hypothetical protein